MKNCDMCGKIIINNKCDCGTWFDKEEVENNPIKKSLENFHNIKKFTLTSDIPHLGCAVVFFRGDYKDCKKVEKFIYDMKGRPYYNKE